MHHLNCGARSNYCELLSPTTVRFNPALIKLLSHDNFSLSCGQLFVSVILT